MSEIVDDDNGDDEFDCSSFRLKSEDQKSHSNDVLASTLIVEDLEAIDLEAAESSTSEKCSTAYSLCYKEKNSPQGEPSLKRLQTTEPNRKVVVGRKCRDVGECHINCLPCELLLKIFSYLTLYDLCTSVAPVCTLWRELSRDPTFWKHLVFSYERRVEGEQVKQLLSKSPLLISLQLQSREDGGDLLLQVAESCSKLRELTVKFCDGLTEEVLKALVENCQYVSHLNIEGSPISSNQCYHLIARFEKLTYLNLSHCQFLDNEGLIAISKQCHHLEFLDIDGITNIFDYAVVCVTQQLGSSLTHLFLDGENLTDASYQSLALCTKLEKLGISFCEQMTDLGLSGISGLNLSWVKLRKGVQLSPNGLQRLFRAGHMGRLTHINLGECCLMDDTVLFDIAEKCPRLTNLVLHWCWEVTDAGITAIICSCQHLKVLDLVGVVQLTGSAFKDINNALPELLILDLEQCNSVDDAILQLEVNAKPTLRVFDYWGDPVIPSEPDEDEEGFL